jgi:hypothetical protein
MAFNPPSITDIADGHYLFTDVALRTLSARDTAMGAGSSDGMAIEGLAPTTCGSTIPKRRERYYGPISFSHILVKLRRMETR